MTTVIAACAAVAFLPLLVRGIGELGLWLEARFDPVEGDIAMPAKPMRVQYLECPCCGNEGAEADKDGLFTDGQPLICGCTGCVTCDSENEPEINAYDCGCRRGEGHDVD